MNLKAPKSIKINASGSKPSTVVSQQIGDIPSVTLKENPKLVEEIGIREVMAKNGFLPPGVHIEDLDIGFMDWVKGFGYEVGGKLVPVNLYTLQRYSEFMQNWNTTDTTNTVQLPLITVIKDSMAKTGSLLGATINLPSRETYATYKEIRKEGGKDVAYFYEVSQPHTADLSYRVSLFANHQRDVNGFNEIILGLFKTGQSPVTIQSHVMEIKLADMAEENKTDLEERRYYHHIYTFTLRGILIDECDFRVKKSLNAINMETAVCEVKKSRECSIGQKKIPSACGCEECYTFLFGRKGPKIVEHKLLQNFQFKYDNQPQNTVNRYYLNCEEVSLPFTASVGDILKIEYNASIMKPVTIKLCGLVL